ncbi:hypothetical protein [Streptomyces sp. CB03238]|uniref:hypothetical protein n=1 Tax=Streptomyces sp. CB03238 TaxID=1907777 RepID=UPI000A0F8D81|nr:hypothetical protein [Streptomyces sp. CB03238]ORT58783.1 hypothetical protein BKD26_16530 [Streptomyces sp. CB03238]
MAFDSEWKELVSSARDQQSAGTRINTAAPGGEGSHAHRDLVVTQDDLGAVGHEAFILHGLLHKHADIAGAGSDKNGSGSTAQAAQELSSHHMAMGGELLTALSVWTSQVKTVLQMCAHISNHLDYSKKSYRENDVQIEASFRRRDGSAVPVSEIAKLVR